MSGIFWADRQANVVFDAERPYEWANAHDGDPSPHDGSTVRAAFTGLVQVGDTILRSSDAAEPVGVAEKAQNYLWADTTKSDGGVDDLITWLLTVSPVVIGISWYDPMFCQDQQGNFVPPADGFVHPTGQVAGGHAICVRGFNALDPNNTYFVLRNSWGPGWGITVNDDWSLDLHHGGGDILLSRADMVTLLTGQGEAGALGSILPSRSRLPPDGGAAARGAAAPSRRDRGRSGNRVVRTWCKSRAAPSP